MGKWITHSSQDFKNNVDWLSYGLIANGIGLNDKVAIISNNRPEWNFTDLGVLQTGAVDVPIYPTISEHDLKFILEDAEVKMIFVSTEELFQKVKTITSALPNIPAIYTFNRVGASHWSELIEKGKENQNQSVLDSMKSSIQPGDLATICILPEQQATRRE